MDRVVKSPKRVKKKETEKLTDANISRVVGLLEDEKNPISKKEACEILCISYNTTRLSSIIENWKRDKDLTAQRKKERKGKPAQPEEIRTIAESLLDGDSIADISKRLYRSPSFVKNIIHRIGIPEKLTGDAKYSTALLPETCVSENFVPEEVAWSAKYHSPCIVVKELTEPQYEKNYGTRCYRIYIKEKMSNNDLHFGSSNFGGYYAAAASYDLGKLSHLEEYGVTFKHL